MTSLAIQHLCRAWPRIQRQKLPTVAVLRFGENISHPHGLGAGARVATASMYGCGIDSRLVAIGNHVGAFWRERSQLAECNSKRTNRTSLSRKLRDTSVVRLRILPKARWNGQSLSSGQLTQVYGFTDLDGSQPDAWCYIREVANVGKPADATGYR